MIFLANMANKGKLQLKKINKGIDEENIVQLDLSCKGFEALDIKYLTEFNLHNLRILSSLFQVSGLFCYSGWLTNVNKPSVS
jgi:hypothetical protein